MAVLTFSCGTRHSHVQRTSEGVCVGKVARRARLSSLTALGTVMLGLGLRTKLVLKPDMDTTPRPAHEPQATH